MTFLCGYLFLCLSALLSPGLHQPPLSILQGGHILNIPPKLQQAFDNGNLEPVTYAELITEVLDAPASQNPAISGTNVDLTDPKAIRMNYPDSAGATSTFIDIGNTDQIVARPFFSTFTRGLSAGSYGFGPIGYQTFTLGEDSDAGQAKRLKNIHIDISATVQTSSIWQYKAAIFGVQGDLTLIDSNGVRIRSLAAIDNGIVSSNSVSAITTAKTSITFNFDNDLKGGNRYALILYLQSVPGATVGSTNVMKAEWYGSKTKQFPNERSVFIPTSRTGDFFDGEFSLQVDLAEYDPSPSPVVAVKFDLLETPTEAGEFSILDRNEKIIDAVTGLEQETSTAYHAWTTNATYAKGTGLDLGVIDISDTESLKIQTTELSRYYLLEVSLAATANGLRSPTFKGAIVKFPKTGALARLSSHPLPNFIDPVITAIKSAPIVPTKMDISNPITKRGKAKLNLVDIGGEITRLAIKQNLLNFTIEIRVGHAPTAKTKDDLALVFSGKITDYTYSEGELSITVEDRTKNLDIRIPRLGTDILRLKRVVIDSGEVKRDWKRDTIPGMLKDILKNESGILSRYIDTASIDAIELNLKAGDTLSPWKTPKEIREPEEASGLIKDVLNLIGGYLVSLEDGRIKIIQWPRPGPALGTWDADILTVDDKQPAGLIKSLVNFCMVSFDIKGDASNKGISAVADVDSIDEWAPGSEEHVSDRFIKTELLGDQLNYNGETIAHKVANRVVKTYKNGVVPMNVVTPFDQFRFQVGDFINITSPVFLKKFNLGSTARKFMITEKKPDIENNKISWSLMEDINHNRLPTAKFSSSVFFGTPSFNVTFTDASRDSDGTINAWAWDFDYDGVNFANPPDSTLQNPTHTYITSNIGIKRVRLKVTDNLGGQDETESTIRVLGAPTAIINATPSAPDQPPTTLLSSGSYGRTGEITKTEWDIGYNGVTFVSDFEGESTNVIHLSTDLIVALRVTDEDWAVSAIVTITIPASTKAIVPGVDVSSLLTTQWQKKDNPKNFWLTAVAWSQSLRLYVAVGLRDGGDAYVVTSSDGEDWTERANPKNQNLNGVAWSPELSLFVAVGQLDGVDAYIITSTNGITWLEQTNPSNFTLLAVTWSPELSLFVAVGGFTTDPDAYIITSPNGTAWTERINPKNITLRDVEWSPELSLLVAVGDSDGVDSYLITSPDGITWLERANPSNLRLRSVTWSPKLSLFVAVGDFDGTDAYLVSSPNGMDWTERENPRNNILQSVVWNGFIFLAVGGSVIEKYIIGSRNGFDWFRRDTGISGSNQLLALSWNDARFLAVGQAGGPGVNADIFSSLSMIGE